MKLVFISLFLFIGLAQANTVETVYNKDTVLIEELKQKVIDAVVETYPCIDKFGLKEIDTISYLDYIDGEEIDTNFVTTFRANYHYEYHPSMGEITVRSVRYDGQNPNFDMTEVLSVKSVIRCSF